MNKEAIILVALGLSGCASTLPEGFVYETSVRGEQGWMGASERQASAETLLATGSLVSPLSTLQAAQPDQDVRVTRWGLSYFGEDWERYQAVLKVRLNGKTICDLSDPEDTSDAPTLAEIRASGALQTRLDRLTALCLAKLR